jgi:hypothetical protein
MLHGLSILDLSNKAMINLTIQHFTLHYFIFL